MNKKLKKSCATALATVMLASSVITASANTLETSSLADAPGIPVTRLEGANRYQTSVAISKADHKDPKEVKNVVIASGEDFADALSGAGLALQLEKAPILLTAKAGLSKEVKEEIKRLSPEKVYILGGTSAVSETVESEITTIELKEKDSKSIKRIEVKRLGGADRFATNKEINDKIYELAGDQKAKGADVYVNAYNYADAVSASNILRAEGKPSRIVLQKGTEIGKLENKKGYIVGGEKAVEITKMPEDVVRFGGKDRYETSAMVAKAFNAKSGKYVFATGEDFPDALTAADVVFSQNATLVLTNRDMLNNFAKNLVASAEQDEKMTAATIIGGTAAISEKTEKTIANPTLIAKSFAFVMPERTPVKDTKKLTDEEVASVKKAIETANKELPVGTKIEVEKEYKNTEERIDDNFTTEQVIAGTTKVIFPDGSLRTLTAAETIGTFDELGMAAKFNAEKKELEAKGEAPEVEKTPVVDKNKLQDKEANAIAEKVKEAYKDLLKDAKSVEVQKTNHTIKVNDEVVLDSVAGRVVITFKDGTIAKFTGDFTREYKIADLVTVKAPEGLTPIENIEDIATIENFNNANNIDDIKKSIQEELFKTNKDLKHDEKEFKIGAGGFVETVAFEAKDATKKDNTPVLVVYFTDSSKVSFDVKDCVEVRTAGKTSDTYELINPVVTAEKDPRVEVTDANKLNKTEIDAIIALVNKLSPLPKYSKVEQLSGYLRVTYLDYSFTDISISGFAKEAK